MKRFFSVILVVFLTCTLFAKPWKYDYEEMSNAIEQIPNLSDVTIDNKLNDFCVYIWKRFFPDYYEKYGVPFICAYDIKDVDRRTSQLISRGFDKDYDFSIILVHDEDIQEYVSDGYYWEGVNAIAYELCQIVVYLECSPEQVEKHPSPYNSVFFREAERLSDIYNLDVNPYY